MKIILITILSFITLFGVEVNEANLADSISKCEARDANMCYGVERYYYKKFKESGSNDIELRKSQIQYALKACELKVGKACQTIATQYADGGGYLKIYNADEAKELEYLNKACEYNNKDSCTTLGIEYERESRSKSGADKKALELKAKRFYKKACDLGDKPGCSYMNEI